MRGIDWRNQGVFGNIASRMKSKTLLNHPAICIYCSLIWRLTLFHQAFMPGSLDEDVIIAFARFIYAYGPDWDEKSKRIEEFVAENKLGKGRKNRLIGKV